MFTKIIEEGGQADLAELILMASPVLLANSVKAQQAVEDAIKQSGRANVQLQRLLQFSQLLAQLTAVMPSFRGKPALGDRFQVQFDFKEPSNRPPATIIYALRWSNLYENGIAGDPCCPTLISEKLLSPLDVLPHELRTLDDIKCCTLKASLALAAPVPS